YDLLYISPEKLLSHDFSLSLPRIKINLFAIDEAHCISSWGHDFRPEYTKMKFLQRQFPQVPIIACTATADRVTRKDIAKQLGLQAPKIFISSFDRPNLSLDVRPGVKRFEQIVRFLNEHPNQSGIIYCLSKKSTENLSQKLNDKGFHADYYHAGMPGDRRSEVQEAFLQDRTPIICATIAFGMGIDKSNVRWVIHYNMPRNIESFYQEIGRAGRDGSLADTLLFYSYGDVIKWKDIIEQNESSQREVKLSKLNRMQHYATALFCRRKVLLNYFSENRRTDCGNCDICNNPPQYFDGTVAAQKALSAIYRVRENIGMQLLIDVLRGSQRREIFDLQLHKVKTYGQGREYSFQEWRYYLEQLLNQGYIEIAHEDGSKAKLTDASKAVLFEGEQVQLVRMITAKEREAQAKLRVKQPQRSDRPRVRDEVFDHLRIYRATLAREAGVPPYIIFSDASLEEMAAMKPTTETAMRAISGVGLMKWNKYGQLFIDQIIEFCESNNIDMTPPALPKPTPKARKTKIPKEPKVPKISTYEQTRLLFEQGLSISEMAEQRGLKSNTIFTHLIKLKREEQLAVDFRKFLNPKDYEEVVAILPQLDKPYRLSEIFTFLNEAVSYEQIRLALAVWEEEQG
ncbi:MAG: RecQ family ATP-dependent DNA helicase, partial [Bacteroidota bacterium]